MSKFVRVFFVVCFIGFSTADIGHTAPKNVEQIAITRILTDNRRSGSSCKDHKVSYSKEVDISAADRENGLTGKWCLLVQYICMHGKWNDYENIILVEKLKGDAFKDPQLLVPGVNNISLICGQPYGQMKAR